jgi:hypothetical protein
MNYFCFEENPMSPSSTGKWKMLIMLAAFAANLFFSGAALAADTQKFTGEVGDAMCGRKHMEGTPTECTRTCAQHGSKYALVMDNKIYILDTSDKAALATLDQEAGKRVTVTGTLKGDEIEVSSVASAK